MISPGESNGLDREVAVPGWYMLREANLLFPEEEFTELLNTTFKDLTRYENEARWRNLKFVSNDPDFSLPVFLAELKECKKIIPGIRDHLRRIRRLVTSGKRIRTLADLLSGGWLDLSYGTGGFIRDIIKLWGLFCNMQSKYRKFIVGMGEQQTTQHIVKNVSIQMPSDQVAVRRLFGVDWEFICSYSVGNAHVLEPYSCLSATYRYYSNAMTGLFGKSKFVAQSLGVIPDPQIAWDLIPLSFVLDWVYPIGELLHRHRLNVVDLQVVVDGAGYGTRVGLNQLFEVRAPVGAAVRQPLGFRFGRQYSRVPVEVNTAPPALQLGDVTMNKAASAASLLWVLGTSHKK
jgi:hypothetical protein